MFSCPTSPHFSGRVPSSPFSKDPMSLEGIVDSCGIRGCLSWVIFWGGGNLPLGSRDLKTPPGEFHQLRGVLFFTGDADIVVAGGQESMSDSPHVLNRSREGAGNPGGVKNP